MGFIRFSRWREGWWWCKGGVTLERGGKGGGPLGQKIVRTTAIPPQPCNTIILQIYNSFLGIKRVGITESLGEGGGVWTEFVSEREEEEVEEEVEGVGSAFDQDGGSLQTWGPPASQDRQKASRKRGEWRTEQGWSGGKTDEETFQTVDQQRNAVVGWWPGLLQVTDTKLVHSWQEDNSDSHLCAFCLTLTFSKSSIWNIHSTSQKAGTLPFLWQTKTFCTTATIWWGMKESGY